MIGRYGQKAVMQQPAWVRAASLRTKSFQSLHVNAQAVIPKVYI